ncbi:glycoside hydrolase family 9 protein [Chitinophaga rhizophila]|uniref:Glycoside hydrolase family 9 protein n=1 Tax=Chitinophaga rhizophila TaxID=2866212 RepID=A0ABS7GDU2_9BACT|nr:glycoside hydrolase family 9 protein [Chitinophaga rhizophila]MBW8685325.1 glycoside hydrolase family 9 protein [Chitinophaga rhizophila]
MKKLLLLVLSALISLPLLADVIRINQLGYACTGSKVAVWCSKEQDTLKYFELVNVATGKVVFKNKAGNATGAYGPFRQTSRLDFTAFTTAGQYYLRTGNTQSPKFSISDTAYKGTADFCLRYLRQQRSGFNPFLKDSCHTHDGFPVYGPDSTFVNVSGGWHDASDYLQYATTSANATWHLLAAWRDFPNAFSDTLQANGLSGGNGIADVLDEAKWGLDWLIKMNPRDDRMYNQVGDDRDHRGMRIPGQDTNFYDRGLERPVYFCTGAPQGLLKYKNRSTGTASTAGKFSSCFALGQQLFSSIQSEYAATLRHKATAAYAFGMAQPGVCQTAPGRSPYFYEEDNWTDDMELAAATLGGSYLNQAWTFARQEPMTPWLGKDTARHYQWYPFINQGHAELARQVTGSQRDTLIHYYKEGIERVWQKASGNAFYRGIPFIWCSNNLTVAFAIQCYWYRQLSGDASYLQLEQACFDWIFGCNPWGTSMVYGLPAYGDTPVDPHSSFTHLKQYPIDGGLVDGPVYTNIFNNLIGIQLQEEDEYAEYQSDLAVYHDDYGDYSTNEPTMDGTAVLIYLLAAQETAAGSKGYTLTSGGITRMDSSRREIALVFTADEFGEGLSSIHKVLQQEQVKGSFFLTGNCYRNTDLQPVIKQLSNEGHYMGPHSDKHLLYCDWNKPDSLLITRPQFLEDIRNNLTAMQQAGIDTTQVQQYIPPYEWWNDSIARWSADEGLQVISFTPGTGTNADYTYPEMGNTYKSTAVILSSVKRFEQQRVGKLNGAILLIHAGTDPRRKDKLYLQLHQLIKYLKQQGYQFKKVNNLAT